MLNQILQRQILPVIVIDDANNAEKLAEALYKGGIDIIEITMRTKAATETIKRIKRSYPDMLIGAGTVLTTEQADQAIDSGAEFALAPGLNQSIVEHFQNAGVTFIPGVMTPSEIEHGLMLGCKLLKFYPASIVGGSEMLRTLVDPYISTGIKFCPTGGINIENMMGYLSLPIVSAIGSSWIASRKQIAEQAWDTITKNSKAMVSQLTSKLPVKEE